MNDTERIDVIMDELEKTVAMQERYARYYARHAVKIIINKVLTMHKMYGFSIDKICSDMKDKLVAEYDANYPIIIENISEYVTASAEEDTVKFALLYYLNKAC